MLLQGVGVSPGVGIGRAVVIAEGSLDYTQVHFAGVQQEKARLRTAVQAFAQRTQAMADALRARKAATAARTAGIRWYPPGGGIRGKDGIC